MGIKEAINKNIQPFEEDTVDSMLQDLVRRDSTILKIVSHSIAHPNGHVSIEYIIQVKDEKSRERLRDEMEDGFYHPLNSCKNRCNSYGFFLCTEQIKSEPGERRLYGSK